jgi:phosphoribosylanthranilate isomerase
MIDPSPRPVRTRIKFCGMTRVDDALAAATLGVDAIGLIFAARSPRRVSLEQAVAIRRALPPMVTAVALLMDNEPVEVARIVATLRPQLLQFHGGEDDASASAHGLPWLKVVPMAEPNALAIAASRFPGAAGFVLDGHRAGEPGGSGQVFDWRLVRSVDRPLVLAGGLGPDNVGIAIRTARPWAVDVASGIERSPGIKDHARMQAFVEAVRSADADGR